ncbi:hypothetical protein N7488_008969 [Penicillium malachiteum]|nr:hypothetical protein N7488_008969 [Penicillium malachiteum]
MQLFLSSLLLGLASTTIAGSYQVAIGSSCSDVGGAKTYTTAEGCQEVDEILALKTPSIDDGVRVEFYTTSGCSGDYVFASQDASDTCYPVNSAANGALKYLKGVEI